MKNMERLFTPKEILERISDLDNASLRHLNTRREMGIISSSKASEKRGQKNLYDLKTALIYCILTELEAKELTIEQAANFAKILILREFAIKDDIWLVLLYGSYNSEIKQSYIGFYKTCYHSEEQIYKNKKYAEDKFKMKIEEEIIINPLPKVFFKFFISEFEQYKKLLKTIEGIKTLEMGDILQKYLDKFQVTEEEIENLHYNSVKNYEAQNLN